MGYLKVRISRQRCAARVAAALERQALADLSAWYRAPDSPPRQTPRTYLRFAVCRNHPASNQMLGVFQAAYELRDRYGRKSPVGRSLGPPLAWFDANLIAPDVPRRAIFWFKSDARSCLAQIWQVIHILRAYDETVWMMRCQRPGMITYDDAFQVAAVPEAAARWRRRPL